MPAVVNGCIVISAYLCHTHGHCTHKQAERTLKELWLVAILPQDNQTGSLASPLQDIISTKIQQQPRTLHIPLDRREWRFRKVATSPICPAKACRHLLPGHVSQMNMAHNPLQ